MESNRYQYLFPFEKVRCGSRVLIYGAGILGIEYIKQINITGYCNLIGMIDQNAKDYKEYSIDVYEPSEIHALVFDYVIIAVRSGVHFTEIKRNLMNEGVAEEKIVCVFEREYSDLQLTKCDDADVYHGLAYEITDCSVAIIVSGGIGDMIIGKRFVQEIIRIIPACKIDIYYGTTGSFIKYLYSDCENINQIVHDKGINYRANRDKYGLALDVVSTRYVHVDNLIENNFEKEYPESLQILKKLKRETEEEGFNLQTIKSVIYQRRMYKGQNAYTAFNYNGTFDIKDISVSIPLLESAKEQFMQLGLKRYITVNFGVGATKDTNKYAKAWSFDYMEKFIMLFKEKYGDIQVVQLGTKDARRLANADVHLLGQEFGVVSHILNNSTFHLDIEGGLVHIASQLGTKCIVLFGPTQVKYFGYENNINICSECCRDCHGLYKNTIICARGMEEPECMYSITPEIVMAEVDRYLSNNE